MQLSLETIAGRIRHAKSVAIFTHMRPDGDALGSALAIGRALDFLQVQNEVCVETELPSNLAFLQGIDKVKKAPSKPYDMLVCVDCSDVQRLGALSDEFLSATRKNIETVNIDHHVSNTRFAKMNFVRTCSANCMNVFALITYMGTPLDKITAEYLLTGLLTDSGNFSHDDVTEETFTLAARLTKAGADIRTLQYELFKKQPRARAELHAMAMSGMRYAHNNRFAFAVVTRVMLAKCGADANLTEGFVDFPLSIDGVEVAATLLEVKFRQYKVSLRSKQYADVNKIAGVYGGGGHVRAAGCMLFGDLEDVIDKLTFTVSQYLND
ncbi:MAG: bifunctional oligoribonuclease/PAP phosphatase NrnA [Clostridia bacterium]|nr:bifunctional oligoribonuclease/PAP phosphatase NrnA [Clostridia bacterium]